MIWNYFTLLNCFQTNAFNANYVILEACLSTRNQRFPACHVLEAMIAAVGCVIQHNVKYPGFPGCACPHQTILNSNFAFLEQIATWNNIWGISGLILGEALKMFPLAFRLLLRLQVPELSVGVSDQGIGVKGGSKQQDFPSQQRDVLVEVVWVSARCLIVM